MVGSFWGSYPEQASRYNKNANNNSQLLDLGGLLCSTNTYITWIIYMSPESPVNEYLKTQVECRQAQSKN